MLSIIQHEYGQLACTISETSAPAYDNEDLIIITLIKITTIITANCVASLKFIHDLHCIRSAGSESLMLNRRVCD